MELTITFKDEFEEYVKKQFGSCMNPQVYDVKSIRIEGEYLYATISDTTCCWSMNHIARICCEEES